MTIALKGNAQGGVIEAGGTPAANVTQATGIPFMKNKLINGEVTRINQRGVANWAAVANGAYGYDRWKKVDASNITQIIEAGNFRPATVHTLSGIGVTTQQITSPASGNWTLPNIPIAATNVQVEEGLEATPFEVRHIGFELSLCQRYYFGNVFVLMKGNIIAGGALATFMPFPVTMRSVPTISAVSNNSVNLQTPVFQTGGGSTGVTGVAVTADGTAVGNAELNLTINANAEIP